MKISAWSFLQDILEKLLNQQWSYDLLVTNYSFFKTVVFHFLALLYASLVTWKLMTDLVTNLQISSSMQRFNCNFFFFSYLLCYLFLSFKINQSWFPPSSGREVINGTWIHGHGVGSSCPVITPLLCTSRCLEKSIRTQQASVMLHRKPYVLICTFFFFQLKQMLSRSSMV